VPGSAEAMCAAFTEVLIQLQLQSCWPVVVSK
jgi:hypothetical protein